MEWKAVSHWITTTTLSSSVLFALIFNSFSRLWSGVYVEKTDMNPEPSVCCCTWILPSFRKSGEHFIEINNGISVDWLWHWGRWIYLAWYHFYCSNYFSLIDQIQLLNYLVFMPTLKIGLIMVYRSLALIY